MREIFDAHFSLPHILPYLEFSDVPLEFFVDQTHWNRQEWGMSSSKPLEVGHIVSIFRRQN